MVSEVYCAFADCFAGFFEADFLKGELHPVGWCDGGIAAYGCCFVFDDAGGAVFLGFDSVASSGEPEAF